MKRTVVLICICMFLLGNVHASRVTLQKQKSNSFEQLKAEKQERTKSLVHGIAYGIFAGIGITERGEKRTAFVDFATIYCAINAYKKLKGN